MMAFYFYFFGFTSVFLQRPLMQRRALRVQQPNLVARQLERRPEQADNLPERQPRE